uniref:mucin-4-like n=1 Tax=Styela clava TaxID=7725 RepID=UPI00193AC725|nr:mucin-4-like [Styela clava]
MGRKLDLGSLTEEEEKIILQVIKRDYTVRKVETNRIGELSKSVENEELKQQEIVKEAVQGEVPIDTLCARCGSKFIWLINPKNQCNGCDLYFCKNKIECIVYDKLTDKCFCNACLKQRDLHALAGNWFYTKLKGKFRRHGGAKVSREFQKRKKTRKSESDSSPGPSKKPARLTVEVERNDSISSIDSTSAPSLYRLPSDRSYDSSSITTLEEGREIQTPLHGQIQENKKDSESEKSDEGIIKQDYDVTMGAVVIGTVEAPLQSASTETQSHSFDIEIQTDDLDKDEDKLSAIKEELEAAISKLLLPKLEELKRSQSEHESELERQKKIDESVKMAEEMIDKALERAREKHSNMPQGPEENVLLTKYLTDSKSELMDKVSSQLYYEAHDNNEGSARSSMRETGTMTETSDSEMESISSQSITSRHRSRDIPLSERLGSLSPDSLRNTLNQSQNSSGSSITQGVVLQKDQLVARADIDNTLGQILDEQGVIVSGTNSPQEFSTELKFTAVGGGGQRRRRLSTEELSDSDSDHSSEHSHELLKENENWSVPEVQKRPSQFGKVTSNNSSSAMMSLQNGFESPYDHLREEDSDSDDREHVEEEQVLASVVRRPDSTMSPPALMSNQVEVVESLPAKKPHLPVDVAVDPQLLRSLSEDLDSGEALPKVKVESPRTPPVEEEIIQAVDREAREFQTPSTTEETTEEIVVHEEKPAAKKRILIPPPRTPSTESDLSIIPEAEQELRSNSSDSESSDSSSGSSEKRSVRRSQILQPARHSVTSHDHNIKTNNLSPNHDLIPDDDDFGDKMAEAIAAQQRISGQKMEEGLDAEERELYEPKQQEVNFDTSVTIEHKVQESMSSISGDESTLDKEQTEREIEESAVAMRMINNKSIEILSDTIQTIEEVKGHSSSESSDSDSDDESSKHESSENIHKINVAEEEIYKNAARTFVMEERMDQIQRDAENLNHSTVDAVERLKQLEEEVGFMEKKETEVRHGVKSIDDIMRELREAGLKAERGAFKRQSLDSATAAAYKENQKKPSRFSLPPRTQTHQIPVNAASRETPSWSERTFKVTPRPTAAPPIENPTFHSTPKSKSSSSSQSSHSSHKSRSHSSSSSHSGTRSRSESDERNMSAFENIEATISAPIHASVDTPHSSGSVTPTHSSRSATPTRSITPTITSPHSTHSRPHSEERKSDHLDTNHTKVPVIIPLKDSSISSNSSSSLHSVNSSHSKTSSEVGDKKLKERIPASVLIPHKESSISSHSASSVHSASSKSSSKSEKEFEEKIPASISIPQKDPSVSSHSASSIHSFNSEKSSSSSHSKSSSEKEYHIKHEIPVPVIIPLKESSISSRSASSVHSLNSLSSAEEELKGTTYMPGLSAAELEESRIPTPVPRKRMETFQIEECATLPAPIPRERKASSSSSSSSDDAQTTLEESLPAKDVRKIVNKFAIKQEKLEGKEGKVETDESGTEYTEPLITMGMNPELEEKKKRILTKKKPLINTQLSTESESSESIERSGKRDKSKYKKDDSWMLRKESDFDSDSASVSSSSSKHSRETGRSSKSGMFHNLSAAEQREMARIALMHLPETAIAEDRYNTKTIKFVRTEDSSTKSPPPTKTEVLPAMEVPVTQKTTIQQESTPSKPPRKEVATAQIHVQGDSPILPQGMTLGEAKKLLQKELTVKIKTDDSGTKFAKREDGWKGTSFNTEAEKANLRNSFDGTTVRKLESNGSAKHETHQMDLSPTDLDRSQVVRGSITMRGGKAMVLTTSPDGKEKAEFKDI